MSRTATVLVIVTLSAMAPRTPVRYSERVIIVLVLVVLALLGAGGFVVLGYVSRKQKHAEQNADQFLDETFNGRTDVTVKINMQTAKYETVVSGAKARGYKLTHQADNQYGPHTLMFEKVPAAQ